MKYVDDERVQIRYGLLVFVVLGLVIYLSGCASVNMRQCAIACKQGDLLEFSEDALSCKCQDKE